MLNTNLRHIVSTSSDQFKPYDRYGDSIAGMSWVPLSGELLNGAFECFLLRMDAGSQSKPHEHTGHEEFLMLDGELIDCDGQSFHGGDYVHFEPGSKHSSHSPAGCTMLVVLRGNNRPLEADELSGVND
jgi:anti-sigma factor ChrR (cupin superfamily)